MSDSICLKLVCFVTIICCLTFPPVGLEKRRPRGKRKEKKRLHWNPRLANHHLIFFSRGGSLVPTERKVRRQKRQSGCICIILHNHFMTSFIFSYHLVSVFPLPPLPPHLFVPSSTVSLIFSLMCFPTPQKRAYLSMNLILALWLSNFKMIKVLRGSANCSWLSICFCWSCTTNIW